MSCSDKNLINANEYYFPACLPQVIPISSRPIHLSNYMITKNDATLCEVSIFCVFKTLIRKI
jgi:hypothetical protein